MHTAAAAAAAAGVAAGSAQQQQLQQPHAAAAMPATTPAAAVATIFYALLQLISLSCAGEVISSAQAPLEVDTQLPLERGDIGEGIGYIGTGQQKGSNTTVSTVYIIVNKIKAI